MADRWDELFPDIEVRFEIKTRFGWNGRLARPISRRASIIRSL
jgi:hypothetical protein